MFTDSFFKVMDKDELVSIVTLVNNEPHVATTWNSEIVNTHDGRLLVPVITTDYSAEFIVKNTIILLTVGNKEVDGRNGVGCGFLIKGRANALSTGAEWDMMKARCPLLVYVLDVVIISLKQTL